MNLMSRGLAIHTKALQRAAGERVTYIRGGTELSVVAVVGQSVFEETVGDGETRIETKTVDWLIAPSEFKSWAEFEPERGDQIRRKNLETYDVFTGSANSVWSWSDGNQAHFRIHSVRRRVPSEQC